MFEKLVSFTKKVADLPDRPSLSSSALKAQFDAAPDEVRVYLNKLIDALKLTTSGDSGAKNIGASTVTDLTGSDVQSLIESLNTVKAKKQQETVKNVSLAAQWVADSGLTPQYYKDEFGRVYFNGSITGGVSSDGTVLWTFDVGYRPTRDIHMTVHGFETDISKFRTAEIVVRTNGQVQLYGGLYIAYLHLGDHSFRTA